jgi:hypothetical protein
MHVIIIIIIIIMQLPVLISMIYGCSDGMGESSKLYYNNIII